MALLLALAGATAGGTLYYVIGPTSGWVAPSEAQIKAGLLGGGGAATAAGSETAPLVTTAPFYFAADAAGLTASVGYTIAFVWSNGTTDSNITTGTFTTSAGAVTQTLTASLFSNSETFFAPTVSVGAVTLSPARFDNSQTFYAATVTPGAVTLLAARFDNAQTFYAPTVTRGAVTLSPGLFTNSNTFYAAYVYDPASVPASSIRFDIATGRIVKIINSSVVLSF